jgi:hypothetical protein
MRPFGGIGGDTTTKVYGWPSSSTLGVFVSVLMMKKVVYHPQTFESSILGMRFDGFACCID